MFLEIEAERDSALLAVERTGTLEGVVKLPPWLCG